jgi:acyl-coenzyme A synthetase/AMP-(fatty) acid ligase
LALVSSKSQLTDGQLALFVLKLAAMLKKAGICKGVRVAVSLPGDLDFPMSLALMHLGAVSYSIPRDTSISKGDYGVEFLVVHTFHSNWEEATQIVVDRLWLLEASGLSEYPEQIELGDDDPCRLVITSGSTGNPKAMLLDFGLIERRLARREHERPASEREFSFISTAGWYGFKIALSAFVQNQPFFAFRVDSKTFFADLIKSEISSITGSPAQLASLLRGAGDHGARFWSLSRLNCSGGKLTPELYHRLRESFGSEVCVRYGSTETANIANGVYRPEAKTGAVGQIQLDTEVKIVSEAGAILGFGEHGQIWIRNEYLVEQYLMVDSTKVPVLVEGWFNTGDVGYIEPSGELVVIGRLGPVVNVGGVKVELTEVEEKVRQVPGISDCFAFTQTDGSTGLDLIFIAVEVEDATGFDQAQERILSARMEARPARIFCMRTLPRSAAGKVMKEVLISSLGLNS